MITGSGAFAAVELFEATGEAQFNSYFVTQYTQNGSSPLNGSVFGANQTGYGSDNVLTYLNHALNFAFIDYARSTRAVNATIQATLKSAFLHQADVLTNYTALSDTGSDGCIRATCTGVPAAECWRPRPSCSPAPSMDGKPNYHEAALQALHFICGRNPVNRVLVSGYGDYQHSSDFYFAILDEPPATAARLSRCSIDWLVPPCRWSRIPGSDSSTHRMPT